MTAALLALALSLETAQAEARAHAPEVAELDARLRAAELATQAASRVFRSNPTISGTYAPGSLTGRSEEISWSVGVSQSFDLSGSWGPRGASAMADRQKAFQERDH